MRKQQKSEDCNWHGSQSGLMKFSSMISDLHSLPSCLTLHQQQQAALFYSVLRYIIKPTCF